NGNGFAAPRVFERGVRAPLEDSRGGETDGLETYAWTQSQSSAPAASDAPSATRSPNPAPRLPSSRPTPPKSRTAWRTASRSIDAHLSPQSSFTSIIGD